jgi:hypothetical protein
MMLPARWTGREMGASLSNDLRVPKLGVETPHRS